MPHLVMITTQLKHIISMLVSSKAMQQLHFLLLARNEQLQFPNKTHSKKLHIPSLVLALALVLLICLASPTSSCTDQEKSSLLRFVDGLSQEGGLATSWKDGTDCCKWEGIVCNIDKVVTDVLLASKGLEGHISESLGDLTGLRHLDLSHNSLSGGLPLELLSARSITILDISFNQLNGALHELPSSTPARPLQVLNISSNLLTGAFPSTIWKTMDKLIALNASNNSFTGSIPADFCNNSPSFDVLEFSFNKLSGNIPPGLGNCSMLTLLRGGYNDLSGTLPNELFNATSLKYLSFPNNDLHGVLDGAHIVNLRNLRTLDLGGNKFSGKIPDSIGQLKRLEEFHLDYNIMSGELPSALCNCTNLIRIDLKSNYFSGELTKVDFTKLSSLKTLDLAYNNFTGIIPESIYSCSSLTALRLSQNKLYGEISSRIVNLKYLSFLSLAGNCFKNITSTLHILKRCRNLTTLIIGDNFRGETMPADDKIDGFKNLQVLGIQGCSLFGKIPLWISKVQKLEVLVLSHNQLTGSIPDSIKALSYLFYLDVSNNSLTGKIPAALMEMPMLKSEKTAVHLNSRVFEIPVTYGPSLQYRVTIALPKVMYLSNNKLTGEIPLDIGQLKALLSLDFSFNNLTGQIPRSVCNLTNLQALDFSNNGLTGAIPAELSNLHFLSKFNVSNNDLEGPVPSGGQFDTFQTSSFDGNNKLCGSLLIEKCGSAEAPPATIMSTKQTDYKYAFMIGFSAFFGVGVVYDQIALSRYFV